MNKYLYHFFCGVLRPFFMLFFPARIEGLENIPAQGGFLLCCNHLSARDPIYLAIHIRHRHIHFMAKAELFRFKPIAFLFRGVGTFPVARGHSDLSSVRTSLKLLADGHGVGLFPQGTRSRDNTRTPMLNGVSMIAMRAGQPLIPVYIDGPYRIFRRTLVRFGTPVGLSDLGRRLDSETLQNATHRIEDQVWALRPSNKKEI